MTTNAELAARLLRGAADFFRHIGEQNPGIAPEMEENARTYEAVASMVEEDPAGEVALEDDEEEVGSGLN